MKPDLSLIIVNINNRRLLQDCLQSIYYSTHRIQFEIIVVDNGSVDGSQDMVKALFPGVKLIENQENLGFTKASNQGLRTADGRYLMLLNDDTMVKDGALDRLVEFMDYHPEAGACGPKLLNLDGTIQRQGGLWGKRFWLSSKPIAVKFIIGAALLARKEVSDAAGLLDENLFFYNDDLDWCLSMWRAGWKIYFVPQAEIIHYGGYSSQRVFNPLIFVEGFKGGLYFCRKHYGETAYHFYRIILAVVLSLCLPFQLFNLPKFRAYLQIIKLSTIGQVPKPVLK